MKTSELSIPVDKGVTVKGGNFWLYGILLGIGASLGNWIGKKFLKKISSDLFRKLVITVMVLSGIIMIAKQSKL